jgi:excisionase family DNA binding protein
METYFNTKELAEYLRIPEQTIRKWVLKNEIAYIRIHGTIRFRLSEIEKWVDGNRDISPALTDSESENGLFNDTETGEREESVSISETAEEEAGDTV